MTLEEIYDKNKTSFEIIPRTNKNAIITNDDEFFRSGLNIVEPTTKEDSFKSLKEFYDIIKNHYSEDFAKEYLKRVFKAYKSNGKKLPSNQFNLDAMIKNVSSKILANHKFLPDTLEHVDLSSDNYIINKNSFSELSQKGSGKRKLIFPKFDKNGNLVCKMDKTGKIVPQFISISAEDYTERFTHISKTLTDEKSAGAYHKLVLLNKLNNFIKDFCNNIKVQNEAYIYGRKLNIESICADLFTVRIEESDIVRKNTSIITGDDNSYNGQDDDFSDVGGPLTQDEKKKLEALDLTYYIEQGYNKITFGQGIDTEVTLSNKNGIGVVTNPTSIKVEQVDE